MTLEYRKPHQLNLESRGYIHLYIYINDITETAANREEVLRPLIDAYTTKETLNFYTNIQGLEIFEISSIHQVISITTVNGSETLSQFRIESQHGELSNIQPEVREPTDTILAVLNGKEIPIGIA